MAGVAVKHHQFGLKALRGVVRIDQRIHALDEIARLPDRPDLGVVDRPLALDIAPVDGEMRGLGRRIGVQLEAHARVSGTHDPVSGKPFGIGRIPEMAGQTLSGARDGLFRRIEPGGKVRGVTGARDVDAEPVGSAAVTGLATDPVRELKLGAAPVSRNVIRVTVQANRGA